MYSHQGSNYPSSTGGDAPTLQPGQRSCPQLVLILISLFLLVTAMILSVIAALSPSWQVVEIREFLAEHHHGLWLDCTRAERLLGRQGLGNAVEKSPLHCTYKIDRNAALILDQGLQSPEPNAAAAEAEHHQFYGWQKAVLIFIILSLLAGGGAFVMGLCSPCSPSCSLIHCVLCFFSLLGAVVASTIFFFSAHRVDSRFVQGLVGTYEQSIGEAFYCYLVACILLMLVFILSIIGAYHSLRSTERELAEGRRRRVEVLTPLYPHAATMAIGQNGLRSGCPPGGFERKTQV